MVKILTFCLVHLRIPHSLFLICSEKVNKKIFKKLKNKTELKIEEKELKVLICHLHGVFDKK